MFNSYAASILPAGLSWRTKWPSRLCSVQIATSHLSNKNRSGRTIANAANGSCGLFWFRPKYFHHRLICPSSSGPKPFGRWRSCSTSLSVSQTRNVTSNPIAVIGDEDERQEIVDIRAYICINNNVTHLYFDCSDFELTNVES